MRICKKCNTNIDHKRSDAIFCTKKCKKDHWNRLKYPIAAIKLTDEERKIKRSFYRKQWRERNKEKHRANMRRYCKERYANDIDYKLAINLRNRLNVALNGNYKSGSAVDSLGCSIIELKKYLESKFQPGMTWDNYGEWHIDHIEPLASFDLSDPKQLKEACRYANLQPLWAENNIRKGAS